MKLLAPIPEKVVIAFSGGADSVYAARFAMAGRRNVSLAFFHHGTVSSELALSFVLDFAHNHKLKLYTKFLLEKCPKGDSLEAFWRNKRYEFLSEFNTPVIMGHHLNDAVETYIFNMLNGTSHTIPPIRGNFLRPFLLFKKETIISNLVKMRQNWFEDESNNDLRFRRNYIRHELLPRCLDINPGLYKIVARKLQKGYEASC